MWSKVQSMKSAFPPPRCPGFQLVQTRKPDHLRYISTMPGGLSSSICSGQEWPPAHCRGNGHAARLFGKEISPIPLGAVENKRREWILSTLI